VSTVTEELSQATGSLVGSAKVIALPKDVDLGRLGLRIKPVQAGEAARRCARHSSLVGRNQTSAPLLYSEVTRRCLERFHAQTGITTSLSQPTIRDDLAGTSQIFAKILKIVLFKKKTTLRVCSLFENTKCVCVGKNYEPCTIALFFDVLEKWHHRREYSRF